MNVRTSQDATDRLTTPIQFVKGVGPHREALFHRLGIKTAKDLLFYFPRDYQDFSQVQSVSEFVDGQPATFRGLIEDIDLRDTGGGKSVLGALLRNDKEYVRAVWFNQPYIRKRLSIGQPVMASGPVRRNGLRWEMTHPRIQLIESMQSTAKGEILPIYRLTEGLKISHLRSVVRTVLDMCTPVVREVFSNQLLDHLGIWPIKAALPQIHFPTDSTCLDQARRRFVFQELFVLQLAIAMRAADRDQHNSAAPLETTARIDARIRRIFPYELTRDQEKAIHEISGDMSKPRPMNRLLMGDVGSGKTAVATYAMLLCVAHGHQAAMLVPTEVLARQHYVTLSSFLKKARVRIGLLIGSLKRSERQRLMERIAAGEIDLIIGTHAIIQDAVQFARLDLVIIDEQHRFGVHQRARLRHGDHSPHYLVMTATPIPRTMALTVFGDLDVSTLRRSPPGRSSIHSYLVGDHQRDAWWSFFRKKLAEGRQGYVIVPHVDEHDGDVASIESMFESLCNDHLAGYRVDIVHGRLRSEEKDAVMDSFRNGQTRVLVATSIVEVGIDVPNATLMAIENAERFGLAQLHQLRGRVGRGKHPGYAAFFQNDVTEDGRKRLEALINSNDGFSLAETDYQLRGPGDLMGSRQHGLPPLMIADLHRDQEILDEAREAATRLIGQDPRLDDPNNSELKKMVLARYGRVLDLVDVG